MKLAQTSPRTARLGQRHTGKNSLGKMKPRETVSSGKSSCSDRVSHPPQNQTSDYVHCLAASLPPHTSTERNCDLGTTVTPGMANPDGDVAMKTALSNSAMSGRRTRPTHDAIPQGPGLVTTMNPRPCRPEPDSAKKQSSRCEAWVPVGSPLLKFSPTSAGNEQTREQLTKYGRGGRPTYLAVVAW